MGTVRVDMTGHNGRMISKVWETTTHHRMLFVGLSDDDLKAMRRGDSIVFQGAAVHDELDKWTVTVAWADKDETIEERLNSYGLAGPPPSRSSRRVKYRGYTWRQRARGLLYRVTRI